MRFSSMSPFPSQINLGFNPQAKLDISPLQTLSLFSGAGNLDFGLEDAGIAEVQWHVEWDAHAVHTIKVNCASQSSGNIFYGSVDDCLLAALQGRTSSIVPSIGEPEAIVAGSPCQGFSSLQKDTSSEESLQNASKIASVASFIDLYRPVHTILENVPSMARKVQGQNAFQRLLCALVGMGYQVSFFHIAACTAGTPSKRGRLFISTTAPGFVPPKHPHLTHSYPSRFLKSSLGILSSGHKYGINEDGLTPFEYVSAQQSTSDLPDIEDGHVGLCIPFTDHRSYVLPTLRDRLMIQAIPKGRPGVGISKVLIEGAGVKDRIPEVVWDYWESQNELRQSAASRSWSRIDPDGLWPTITCSLTPGDYRLGSGLHWEQDRTWTVMEARRAQGIPDDFVLIGNAAQQWKLIGNGVPRPVSLALGLSLRKAWLSNNQEIVSAKRSAGLDVYRQQQQRRKRDSKRNDITRHDPEVVIAMPLKPPASPHMRGRLDVTCDGDDVDPLDLSRQSPTS